MPRDLRARLRSLLPFVRRRSHERVLADWRELRAELRMATAETRAARDALRRVQRSVRFSEAADEAWEALLREASAYHPVRDETPLFYQPSENPYLRLLYGGCPEVGIRPRPIPTLKRLEQLEVEGIVHLHWASFLQPPGRDAAHVREANRAFLAALDAKRSAGLRFLWTIHEPLPHDCRLPDEEIQLRGELARRADAIHVLHSATLDEIGGSTRSRASGSSRCRIRCSRASTPTTSPAARRGRCSASARTRSSCWASAPCVPTRASTAWCPWPTTWRRVWVGPCGSCWRAPSSGRGACRTWRIWATWTRACCCSGARCPTSTCRCSSAPPTWPCSPIATC